MNASGVEPVSPGCAECGASLGGTEQFCPACGTPVSRTTERAALADVKRSFADLYEVTQLVGEGGWSRAYLARDRRRACTVLLKVLRPEQSGTVFAARFLREIDITRSLHHESILPLYDSGEVPSSASVGSTYVYLTLPYVEGEDLEDRLRREGPLPIEESIRIACAVANALQYAHEMQVVHRDVKTGNILLAADRRVLVTDFGVAKALNIETSTTQVGTFVGTVRYLSPEACQGLQVDARTDQYALACVLFEMLTGDVPFSGSLQQMVMGHLSQDPPAVRVSRKTVPEHVDAAIARALQKRPADRFASIAGFARALQRRDPRTQVGMWGPLPDAVDETACFVVMPFGPIPGVQELYRDHVEPTLRACGLQPFRADDIFGHREVIRDIWHAIGRARVIVADVTGRNPNVFYELGMAHAIGKDVVILAQDSADVPFDITHLRYIKYEYSPRGVKEFERALTRTIEALLRA